MITLFLSLCFTFACSQSEDTPEVKEEQGQYADVVKVVVSGSENAYSFSITLKSPDQGCDQYANWWEVITEDETLIYRRILGHSHVNEQPFTRSGGTVKITSSQLVIVRAHMNNAGYGSGLIAMKGSVDAGFEKIEMIDAFAKALESVDPQPTGCAF